MIKGPAAFTASAIIVTLAYVLAFQWSYPLTPMNATTYAFLAFCGVVTCSIAAGLWRLARRSTATKP